MLNADWLPYSELLAMARRCVIPRACTLHASSKTIQTVLLVLVAVGITSAYAMARKAPKKAGEVGYLTLLEYVVISKLTTLGDLGRK